MRSNSHPDDVLFECLQNECAIGKRWMMTTIFSTHDDALRDGVRVVVHGVESKPELNGRFGVCDGFDDQSARWVVRFESDAALCKLRPQNLRVPLPEQQRLLGLCFHVNQDVARASSVGLVETIQSDLVSKKDIRLRSVLWYFLMLQGHDLIPQIRSAFSEEGGGALNWSLNVAFGAAYHLSGSREDKQSCDRKKLLERAVCIRLDTLGELHPLTASSFELLGKFHHENRQYMSAVIFLERALRINMEVLGLHPATAVTMSELGESYCCMVEQDQMKKLQNCRKAVKLHKHALCILTNNVGRMHPLTCDVIFNMSNAYGSLKQYDKAINFGEQVLEMWTSIFGEEHTKSRRARDLLYELRPMLRQQQIHGGM